jgi:hypothetical protein
VTVELESGEVIVVIQAADEVFRSEIRCVCSVEPTAVFASCSECQARRARSRGSRREALRGVPEQ